MNLFAKEQDLCVNDLSREYAIVIYKDKLYKAVNHQEALELALNDEGKTLGLNLESKDLLVAEKVCDDLKYNCIISTWNWYSDDERCIDYLIASDEDNFKRSRNLKVITELGLELGYFISNNKIELKK